MGHCLRVCHGVCEAWTGVSALVCAPRLGLAELCKIGFSLPPSGNADTSQPHGLLYGEVRLSSITRTMCQTHSKFSLWRKYLCMCHCCVSQTLLFHCTFLLPYRMITSLLFGLVANACPTLATPWTIAGQVPLSMGFSRQEYWSGLPFPSPGDPPSPQSNLGLLRCRQSLYWLSCDAKENTNAFFGLIWLF